MSIVDKVIAAVTPPESQKDRYEARAKATRAAEPGDWLSLILDHHIELEDSIAEVEDSATAEDRMVAFKEFAILLTGHSIAEEGVLYPPPTFTRWVDPPRHVPPIPSGWYPLPGGLPRTGIPPTGSPLFTRSSRGFFPRSTAEIRSLFGAENSLL